MNDHVYNIQQKCLQMLRVIWSVSVMQTGIIENRAGRGGGGVREEEEEEGGLISLGRDVGRGYERRKPESERCKKESEKSKLQRKSLRRQQEKCDHIQKSARGEKVQKGEK